MKNNGQIVSFIKGRNEYSFVKLKKEVEMKKIVNYMIVFIFLFSGCSAFVPKTETINVACSEPDATLQINGQHFKGSAQTDVPRNKNVAIMCSKTGYFPAQRTIDYSLSGTGVVDAVGTVFFLFPGIGLFTDGAWSLDENNINVSMIPN